MSLWAWVWLIVGGTFAAYVAVLLWIRTREVGVFYAAEQRVPAPLEGLSIAADWISAASFLSLAGVMARAAADGAVYLAGWALGLVALGFVLAPRLRRLGGAASLPQLLAERLAGRGPRALGALCAALVCVLYAAGQLRGAALVLSRYAPLAPAAALAVATAAVLLHTALSGLRTLPQGQAVRYLVLAAAYLAPAAALTLLFTGNPVPQLAPLGRLTPGGAALVGAGAGEPFLPAVDRLGQAAGLPAWLAPAAGGGAGGWQLLATALALAAGTAALPQLLPRFATPRARGGRAAAGWALGLVLLLYSAVPAMALFARAARAAAGPVDPDLLVLFAPETAGLAPPWVALVAAGALAAALATAAGLVPLVGRMVAQDLVGVLWPRLPEEAQRRWARTSAVVGAGLAALLAARPPGPVLQLVGAAFGLAAATLFPAVVAALYRPRLGAGPVAAAMAAGLVFTGGHLLRWIAAGPGAPGAQPAGLSPEAAGAVGALLGGAVLVVGARWPRRVTSGPGAGAGGPT